MQKTKSGNITGDMKFHMEYSFWVHHSRRWLATRFRPPWCVPWTWIEEWWHCRLWLDLISVFFCFFMVLTHVYLYKLLIQKHNIYISFWFRNTRPELGFSAFDTIIFSAETPRRFSLLSYNINITTIKNEMINMIQQRYQNDINMIPKWF